VGSTMRPEGSAIAVVRTLIAVKNEGKFVKGI
jgi:hypothetical protein